MKEETSMNVWKEWFLIKIHFLTRNDDLRKVAGNWTWPETGPHTVDRIAFFSGTFLVSSEYVELRSIWKYFSLLGVGRIVCFWESLLFTPRTTQNCILFGTFWV